MTTKQAFDFHQHLKIWQAYYKAQVGPSDFDYGKAVLFSMKEVITEGDIILLKLEAEKE